MYTPENYLPALQILFRSFNKFLISLILAVILSLLSLVIMPRNSKIPSDIVISRFFAASHNTRSLKRRLSANISSSFLVSAFLHLISVAILLYYKGWLLSITQAVFILISEIQIPCIHLVKHVRYIIVIAVCDYYILYALELVNVADYARVKEGFLLHRRLVHNNLYSLRFDSFHYSLNRGRAEVVRV